MRIVGFGACMIDGFGVGKEFSFFNQSLNLIRSKNIDINFSDVTSLGGFPINRAAISSESQVPH
jgi:hypothetical protein